MKTKKFTFNWGKYHPGNCLTNVIGLQVVIILNLVSKNSFLIPLYLMLGLSLLYHLLLISDLKEQQRRK